MNTIIDATIIRSRMTSSRILSPKRAGCAVILVVSFLAPVSFFCCFPSGTAPCRCFFSQTAILQWFWQFFSYFLFRQSSHLIYFHILQIKIFQYIILSQNSFARKIYLGFRRTKVSCFFVISIARKAPPQSPESAQSQPGLCLEFCVQKRRKR